MFVFSCCHAFVFRAIGVKKKKKITFSLVFPVLQGWIETLSSGCHRLNCKNLYARWCKDINETLMWTFQAASKFRVLKSLVLKFTASFTVQPN